MHATMRVATGFVLLLIACCVTEAGTIEGIWRTTGKGLKPRIQLSWEVDDHFNNSTMSTSESETAFLRTPGTGPVNFTLVREAGTFQFEGKWKNASAAGDFTFTSDPSVLDRLRAVGVSVSSSKKWSGDKTLISLAAFDVSTVFAKELANLGYGGRTLDELIAMRIHGVDGNFIRAMQGAGYPKLEVDTLLAFRIHEVTPAYIKEMKLLGYASVATEDLIATRIHSVTPEFIRDMEQLGYRNLSLDDLVAMRIHGVTPAYVREMRAAGFVNLTGDELVRLRIHGIDGRYAKAMKKEKSKN